MFGKVASAGGMRNMMNKRRSMGGTANSERASLREALRNRGGAKALVTPAQSEAEDNEDPRSGLAWLDLNAFSSTAVKHAIDKLRSDVEKQIDRVRAPGTDTDAEASAGEEPPGAGGMSLTLGGFRIGGGSSSSSTALPVPKPKAKPGGLKAALQARGGVRRQDPKVLADLERVAEALEHIEGAEESSPSATPPLALEPPQRLSVVEERAVEEQALEEEAASAKSPRTGAEDVQAAPGPAPPAPTPGSEASPWGAASPPEAETEAEAEALVPACATLERGAAEADRSAAADVAETSTGEAAGEAPVDAADGEASDEAVEAPPVRHTTSCPAVEVTEASPGRRAAGGSAAEAAAATEEPPPPQKMKLKVASLGADAWWLHQGKKGGQPEAPDKAQRIEPKEDPRLNRGTIGSKEPGKLNTLQEFWGGGKKTQGFAAGPQLDGPKGRLSKVEAQAALQRLVSAGSDLDEVRRLRKLIAQLD